MGIRKVGFLFLMLCGACNTGTTLYSELRQIDFYNNQSDKLSLKDIGYRAEVLRLSFPSDTLFLGNVSSMVVTDSVIYLLETPPKTHILAFDLKTGNYKGGFYKLGRGPGEFRMALSMAWDGEHIYLKDLGKQALMFYDADLNFVKQIDMPESDSQVVVDNRIWYKPLPDSDSSVYYNLALIDENGKYVKGLLPENRDLKSDDGEGYARVVGQGFLRNGGELYFMKTMKSVIYKIEGDTVIPKYKMILGPNELSEDYDFTSGMPIDEGKRVPMVMLMSGDRLVSQIQDFGSGERVWGCYNMKTGKSVVGNVDDESGIPFYVKASRNGVLYYPYAIYPGIPNFEKFCKGAGIDPETVPEDGEVVILKYIPID